MANTIVYLEGDATQPIKKPACIVHVCNDIAVWGAGFVLALSRRFGNAGGSPEACYREWARKKVWPSSILVAQDVVASSVVPSGASVRIASFELGQVQFVQVADDLYVANMIAQHDVGFKSGQIPLRYDMLRECLIKVYSAIDEIKAFTMTVHMPRIGCGLAGGNWNDVEKIIRETATVDTYVYSL